MKNKKNENVMREAYIEKVVVNCGATDDKLERSVKLLEMLTNKKIKQVTSYKRIPAFEVRPGIKTGCMVTLRGKEKIELLKRLFGAVENKIKAKQIKENHFSFGIKEYLEIPDLAYRRDIGILGLDVTVVFSRKGKRVELRKKKRGKVPSKQRVSKEEIIDYLKNKFNVEIE